MEKSLLEEIQICTNILLKIAVPVIFLILGLSINNSYKERDVRQKYIEIAVGILSNKPSPDTLSLRNWAINTINHNAETKMTTEVKEFLKQNPLPKLNTIDNTNISTSKNTDTIK
jgi:hypothetical protein